MDKNKSLQQVAINLLRISSRFNHLTLKEVWNQVMDDEDKCGFTLKEVVADIID